MGFQHSMLHDAIIDAHANGIYTTDCNKSCTSLMSLCPGQTPTVQDMLCSVAVYRSSSQAGHQGQAGACAQLTRAGTSSRSRGRLRRVDGPESGDGDAAAASRATPSGLVTMSWKTASLSTRRGLLRVLASPAAPSMLNGSGRPRCCFACTRNMTCIFKIGEISTRSCSACTRNMSGISRTENNLTPAVVACSGQKGWYCNRNTCHNTGCWGENLQRYTRSVRHLGSLFLCAS